MEAIFQVGRLSKESIVADIAAGTGLLTRHFTGRVRRVYAVEPNPDMRAVATRELAANPSVQVIDGSAEATTLPQKSVDLISVAQAIHWLEPQATKQEIGRILKQNGSLAIMRNNVRADPRYDALDEMIKREVGPGYMATYPNLPKLPDEDYFAAGAYQKLTYDIHSHQDLDTFIGVLSTVSYMPAEDDPRFARIKEATRRFFDRYSQDGYLIVKGETELLIGQPALP